MSWDIHEALDYYKSKGAPGDQFMLVELLKEIQSENGGALSMPLLEEVASAYEKKMTFLLAVIKRIPSLHLQDKHILEICLGKVCGKSHALSDYVEKTYGKQNALFELRYLNCLRMCGKGPNIRYDGKIYNGATPELIDRLVHSKDI